MVLHNITNDTELIEVSTTPLGTYVTVNIGAPSFSPICRIPNGSLKVI